ncbi:MAG: ROK family transcriptional regulator [Clostridia bacterium]|nr:ROK family transcriptional regulator [Clostridia bacterium]
MGISNEIGLGMNARSIRAENMRKIIYHLCKNREMSRADLAGKTGLTQATMTYIIRDMLDMGIVVETGQMSGFTRRPAIGLKLNPEICSVSLLIERRYVTCAIVRLDGEILMREQRQYENGDVPEALGMLKTMVGNMLGEISDRCRIMGLGIAVPGPFNSQTSHIELVSGVPGWENTDFTDEFSRFGYPVFVEHNAKCGALSQLIYNPAVSSGSVLFLLAGYGVGAGLIFDGRLHRGKIGTAGEIGHLSVDVNGPKCSCGLNGCLEIYCSLGRFREQYRAATGTPVEGETFCGLVNCGDPVAVRIFDDGMMKLASVLAGLTNTLGLECVIFSGEMSRCSEHAVPLLEKEIKGSLLGAIAASVSVVPGPTDYDGAVIVGSAANVMERTLINAGAPMDKRNAASRAT